MIERMTSNLQFHGQALTLRSQRHQLLASNIANADTPQYKARDFDFGQALAQATGAARGTSTPQATDARHLAGGTAIAGSELRRAGSPDALYRTPEQPSIDGNTVDLNQERAQFADNAMRYEATLRFINGNVRNLLSAMRGE